MLQKILSNEFRTIEIAVYEVFHQRAQWKSQWLLSQGSQVVYLAGVSHFVHFGVEAQLPFLPGDSCLCLANIHLNITHTPLLVLRV